MSNIKMYKRGKYWTADLRPYGIGRVATGQMDKTKARQMAKRMLQGIETGVTLTAAMNRAWHEHYVNMKSGYNVFSQMKGLRELHGDTQLDDITTPMLVDWRQGMLDRGLAAKTVNRYLSLVSKVLNLSTYWGYIDAVPTIPLLPEGSGRVRVVTDEEFATLNTILCGIGHQDVSELVNFLLDTGCRVGEALRITPEARESALMSGRWTVWETKGGKPRTIPLTDRARRALQLHGWAGMKNADLTRVWNFARGQMGLDKDPEFVPHALRHTRASQLVNDGHDLY